MEFNLALIAGSFSSVIFAVSVMPMLVKAVRTRDLSSYSPGNLLLANLGNLVHSVYIFSLPAGPIWALHSFYLITTGFMLALYLRHRTPTHPESQDHDHRNNRITVHLGSDSERNSDSRQPGHRDERDLQDAGVPGVRAL